MANKPSPEAQAAFDKAWLILQKAYVVYSNRLARSVNGDAPKFYKALAAAHVHLMYQKFLPVLLAKEVAIEDVRIDVTDLGIMITRQALTLDIPHLVSESEKAKREIFNADTGEIIEQLPPRNKHH